MRPRLEDHGHGADGDRGESEGVLALGLSGGGDLPFQEFRQRPVDPREKVPQGQEKDDDPEEVHVLRIIAKI